MSSAMATLCGCQWFETCRSPQALHSSQLSGSALDYACVTDAARMACCADQQRCTPSGLVAEPRGAKFLAVLFVELAVRQTLAVLWFASRSSGCAEAGPPDAGRDRHQPVRGARDHERGSAGTERIRAVVSPQLLL